VDSAKVPWELVGWRQQAVKNSRGSVGCIYTSQCSGSLALGWGLWRATPSEKKIEDEESILLMEILKSTIVCALSLNTINDQLLFLFNLSTCRASGEKHCSQTNTNTPRHNAPFQDFPEVHR
jgi:hypothetical protein